MLKKIEMLETLNRQLAESKFQLDTILKLSPVGIGITRLTDGLIIDFNDALLAVIGYEAAEVIGHSSAELETWVDQEQRADAFSRLAAGEDIRDMQVLIRRKDGAIRRGYFSASVVQLDSVPHCLGSLRDATDEIDARIEREKAWRSMRAILDNIPSMIGYWDRDLRNRYGNHAYKFWFGIDPEKMTGLHMREVIGEKLFQLNLPYIEAALAGQRQTFEQLIPAPDGSFMRNALAEYIPDIVGEEVQGFYALVSDITPVKAVQTALSESEERYRTVLEDQTELIGRYRPDGVMIFVNEVYCRFFGKAEAELTGRTWHPEVHPDDIAMIEAKLASIAPANPVVTIENRVYGADGKEHWMQFVNRGFFDAAGCLKEIQSVGRDISARKRAEQDLAASRAQLRDLLAANDRVREEQRKEISREIHDQLGALLTTISFRIDALGRNNLGNLAVSTELALIKSLVTQSADTARNICNTLRPPLLDDLGLIPTCRWYLADWSRLVGIPVRGRFGNLPVEPSEQLSTDLFRIFQELLTNIAKHAGASAVRASIAGTRRGIRLRVSDSGGGFSKNQKGPGFGLAGIRERAVRHGGDVAISSGAGGTTVSIDIPLAGVR